MLIYGARNSVAFPPSPSPLINMGSGDYLGLAIHPAVCEGAIAAVRRFGVGMAMNQPFATTDLHERLREDIARFSGTEAAVLFGSCTAANIALITTLASHPGSCIVTDAGCHPSTIDGCRLARGVAVTYETRRIDALVDTLARPHVGRPVGIVTDGVFSIDGALAAVDELHAVASANETLLIVDESHSAGVVGAGGRGTPERFEIRPRDGRVVLTGTFAKAFGAGGGGYVCGPADLIEEIRRVARFYMFNTGMHIAAVGAGLVAIGIASRDDDRRERLRRNVGQLRHALSRSALTVKQGETPIVSIAIGDDLRARRLQLRLRESGIVVTVVGAPIVDARSASLRVQCSAEHLEGDIDRFCDALKREAAAVGAQGGC